MPGKSNISKKSKNSTSKQHPITGSDDEYSSELVDEIIRRDAQVLKELSKY